jgi:hypothetical protein
MEGIPPYRILDGHHCSVKKTRKRLSDIRIIMTALEERAVGRDGWDPENPTQDSVTAVFLDALCAIPWKGIEPSKRHLNQAWMIPTATRKLRESLVAQVEAESTNTETPAPVMTSQLEDDEATSATTPVVDEAILTQAPEHTSARHGRKRRRPTAAGAEGTRARRRRVN